MSDLLQEDTIKQFSADGITDKYDFTFYTPSSDDIDVYVTLANANPLPANDIKVLNIDYTVQFLGGFNGGSVKFIAGKIPPVGATVTLSRNVKTRLNVEFANASKFNGQNLDTALERLLLLIQQNKTLINSDQQRVLSYFINAFATDANIKANTQIPVLGTDEVWQGTGTGVRSTKFTLSPDWSSLSTNLGNATSGADGARLVGYFDPHTGLGVPTTVSAFLDNILTFITDHFPDTFIKPGMLADFAGVAVPAGWLACDGAEVATVTYPALYAAIADTWGVPSVGTVFKLPDFRRRVAVGSGGTAISGTGIIVGNTGGEETHTMTEAEMFAHAHPGSTCSGSFLNVFNTSSSGGALAAGGTTAISVNIQGSSQAFNVMQPSAVVLKIIKF